MATGKRRITLGKITTAAEAVRNIKDGDVILVGGFLMAGSPETLIKALLETSGAKDLTVVSNDTGTADSNMIKVMKTGRVIKVHASYIGANPMTGQMLIDDPNSVTLYPQGTLAEKLRCGGAGIAGFYTPVGVGTVIAEGKESRIFDGREYLLETALRGNVAFVKATIADKFGNCFLRGSTKNFGAIMARAADYVVAEAQKIVEVGELDPELVTIPGIFIDALVQSEDA
ncbi:MAG: CoA transferase subunit A [Clostridiales bacterium]|jgi:acetate CoA/acetoacetate CoA-transferase alpha subunit|nr:CoA transferase subunit A [Clostridiales bacterium]